MKNIEYSLLCTEKKRLYYFRKDVIAIDKWCTVLTDRNKCVQTCTTFGDKVTRFYLKMLLLLLFNGRGHGLKEKYIAISTGPRNVPI
jgi:hypothetical protein